MDYPNSHQSSNHQNLHQIFLNLNLTKIYDGLNINFDYSQEFDQFTQIHWIYFAQSNFSLSESIYAMN